MKISTFVLIKLPTAGSEVLPRTFCLNLSLLLFLLCFRSATRDQDRQTLAEVRNVVPEEFVPTLR
jgi:hypothetical protein